MKHRQNNWLPQLIALCVTLSSLGMSTSASADNHLEEFFGLIGPGFEIMDSSRIDTNTQEDWAKCEQAFDKASKLSVFPNGLTGEDQAYVAPVLYNLGYCREMQGKRNACEAYPKAIKAKFEKAQKRYDDFCLAEVRFKGVEGATATVHEGKSFKTRAVKTCSIGKTQVCSVKLPDGEYTYKVAKGKTYATATFDTVGEPMVFDVQDNLKSKSNTKVETRFDGNGNQDTPSEVPTSAWVTWGVGGGLLIAGGVFTAMRMDALDKDKAFADNPFGASFDEVNTNIEDANLYGNLEATSYTLGGAAVLTGVILLLLHEPEEPKKPSDKKPQEATSDMSIIITPNGAVLGVTW